MTPSPLAPRSIYHSQHTATPSKATTNTVLSHFIFELCTEMWTSTSSCVPTTQKVLSHQLQLQVVYHFGTQLEVEVHIPVHNQLHTNKNN
jgi:hypothetical protein